MALVPPFNNYDIYLGSLLMVINDTFPFKFTDEKTKNKLLETMTKKRLHIFSSIFKVTSDTQI